MSRRQLLEQYLQAAAEFYQKWFNPIDHAKLLTPEYLAESNQVHALFNQYFEAL